MRKLDRVVRYDERSRNYSVAKILTQDTPVTKIWDCPVNLDQGQEGACVGFGWTHEAAADPDAISPVTASMANALYHRAQQLDEWDGESYDGTSVLAGAKAAMEYTWLTEYRWAFSAEDAYLALSHLGPGVIGVNWYEGMWDTDRHGFIHPTGSIVGGHCLLVRGIIVEDHTVLLHNSWGPNWGGTKYGPGTALMTWEEFSFLLKNQGEFCIPLVRSVVGPEPAPEPPVPPTPEPAPKRECRLLKWFRWLFGQTLA